MTTKPDHPYKKHKAGRPKTIDTTEQMQALIDAYFDSCWEYSPVIGQFGLIKNPHFIKGEKPYKNTSEEAKDMYIHKWQLARHPSICDLALAIGMTSRSLLNYEKDETFFPTIERAKEIVKSEIVQSSYNKGMSKGAIWNLMQNFDQSEKKTIATDAVITIGGEDFGEE